MCNLVCSQIGDAQPIPKYWPSILVLLFPTIPVGPIIIPVDSSYVLLFPSILVLLFSSILVLLFPSILVLLFPPILVLFFPSILVLLFPSIIISITSIIIIISSILLVRRLAFRFISFCKRL